MHAEITTTATAGGFVEVKLLLKPMTEDDRRAVDLFAAVAHKGTYGIQAMQAEKDGRRSLSAYCPLPGGSDG